MSFSVDSVISICAVMISVLSLIASIVFSRLQMKHNINSVRPISSIRANDYEDNIAVKIANVGTGPLMIKSLKFKDALQESASLISMMPKIDQPWDDFTENANGWTLSVGGSLTLIELNPENNETKAVIRNRLSQITVLLDYEDIYGTKFNDRRTLDFFGRHSDNSSHVSDRAMVKPR